MRPPAFFSMAAAKRFIHSCCPSLSVAVASFMTKVLLSWAAAPPQMMLSATAAIVLHQFLLVIMAFPLVVKLDGQINAGKSNAGDYRGKTEFRSSHIGATSDRRARTSGLRSSSQRVDSQLHSGYRRCSLSQLTTALISGSSLPMK